MVDVIQTSTCDSQVPPTQITATNETNSLMTCLLERAWQEAKLTVITAAFQLFSIEMYEKLGCQ